MEYTDWKDETWEEYLHKGYVDLVTGFRSYEILKRTELLNRPIQGPAFHCLLWVIIRANREMKKKKLKSLIIGQIHDSLLIDCVDEEMAEVIAIVRKWMCKRIQQDWEWITVPLEIECEASPIGGNWFEKHEDNVKEAA